MTMSVIDWIYTFSKLNFQPESDKHRTKTENQQIHRTKTENQNKQNRANTTKSKKQTKDWKYVEITYLNKKRRKNNLDGRFGIKVDHKSSLEERERVFGCIIVYLFLWCSGFEHEPCIYYSLFLSTEYNIYLIII